ncbi:PUA-like domain-containing protein [Favolaschia claudopus]|uniref:PUA-like domain-containing protein n=1 Tax=Favolaschia claudopus TaxID=2862362 RepID=A0AAW0B1S4_9AGAR
MGMEELRRRLMNNKELYPEETILPKSKPHKEVNTVKVQPKYGALPGIKVGAVFEFRRDLHQAGMHLGLIAGISGSKAGAYSIVLSGGYEDDNDEGDTFVYIGTGGKDNSAFGSAGPQVRDQSMSHPHNSALEESSKNGKPVRVIRGANPNSAWAPAEGYRYDGLYTVTEATLGKGRSGFNICQFRFVRLPGQTPLEKRNMLFY